MANMNKLSGVDAGRKKKGLLITPELCTACRGCQVACKEWNQLPATRTKQTGTYENPPDLSADLYNKIKFIEVEKGDNVEWLFLSQRCMHCTDAGCISVCPAPGALFWTKEGAVGFNKAKCIGCKFCLAGCPFDIPRFDKKGKIAKCDLCANRIANGMEPACSKVCPTGSIRFGDRDALITGAKANGYSSLYGEKSLDGLGVMFAFAKKPSAFGMADKPGLPGTISAWEGILKPLAFLGLGGAITAAAIHYVTCGPSDEEGGEQ